MKFLLGLHHFWCSGRRGKYSCVHLVQNGLTIYWSCFHHQPAYWSSFVKTPDGRLGRVFSNSRWLGVRASQSLASSDVLVIGHYHNTWQSLLYMKGYRALTQESVSRVWATSILTTLIVRARWRTHHISWQCFVFAWLQRVRSNPLRRSAMFCSPALAHCAF